MTEDVQSRTILVVEDDAALRTLFRALLMRQGWEVECVNDGAQALDRLAHQNYAVMVLDLMMPITNGFDVLSALAEKQPPLLRKTIVITGVSERDLAKVDADTVFAVLRKPFDIDCLVTTIHDCARQNTRRARRPRLRAADTAEDDGDGALDAPTRRFERSLPELRQLLRSPITSDSELTLRSELRRAMNNIAGVLAAAATVERDDVRAKRLVRIAESASALAPKHAANRILEH